MPEQNPLFSASVELGQEMAQRRREAIEKSKNTVPYGKEKVDIAKLMQRLQESPSLREKLMADPGGRESLLALIRRQRKGK